MEASDVIKKIENNYPIDENVLSFWLHHIGDWNPRVRDEIVYGSWVKLVIEHKLMQSQKLNILQRVLRDKFLLQGLGVPNSNTVLNRSFTALLLALLLEDSNNKSWISEEDQIKIMNQAFSWLWRRAWMDTCLCSWSWFINRNSQDEMFFKRWQFKNLNYHKKSDDNWWHTNIKRLKIFWIIISCSEKFKIEALEVVKVFPC